MSNVDARIELPQAPPPRWTRAHATLLSVSLLGATLGGGWGAHLLSRGGEHAHLALGLAAPFGLFTLAFLGGRGAVAGKAAWVLGRRADLPQQLERWGHGASMIAMLLAVLAAAIGIVVAAAEGSRVAQASVPALTALGALLILLAIAGRVWVVRASLGLVRRLHTTTLARLQADEGNVELVLSIPDGGGVVEVPFLRGRWSGVQLDLDFRRHTQTWPQRLTVRDYTGSAELDLGGFELCGWRSADDVETWTGDRPPLIGLIREATGSALIADEATNARWKVWALEPGDTLYVVGDATEVQRGFGAYRSTESTTVGSRRGAPAIAYIGEEAELLRDLTRELRLQPLVALLAAATVLLLAWATAILLP
ncbi:MAG TPA: hypothetical protein VML75_06640 [Kofleriaceae bacterium]|nr:hypothetical protein [Kofleriaceae bacterium]